MGWFGPPGSLNGLKLVFPSSPDSLWYGSYKLPGCGLLDECAYNISSIDDKASMVAALLEHEMNLLPTKNAKDVFLAGFSQGAQMTGYMQLAKLPYALGGVIVIDGFPLPPLGFMPGAPQAAARANASYYGEDMRWMVWQGSADQIFPVGITLDTWDGIFSALGCSDTVKIRHIEQGMTHDVIEPELLQMVQFVRNGTGL
jgi:predicted esterase